MEDFLDATAGAYPAFDPSSDAMRKMAWVFEPYSDARLLRRINSADASALRDIIESVCGRVSKYVMGHGEEIELDVIYDRIGGVLGGL